MAVFRIEKTRDYTVMSNHHLKDRTLTLKSKGLLSMMLSLPDEWNYTTRGLAAICREGVDSIGAALKELETHGYIRRTQLRDEKGKITDTEYVIYEMPQCEPPSSPGTPLPGTAKPYTENPDMGIPDTAEPCTENPAQLNTNQTKTDLSSTEISNPIQSNPPTPTGARMGTDRMGARECYREVILDNIEYSYLVQDNHIDREQLDEIVDLIVDTVCSARKVIRIAGDDYPAEVVKSRFMKLDSSHVQYVMDCMKDNTTYVRNIKKYLLAALYNAPTTINSYYSSLVQHDISSREPETELSASSEESAGAAADLALRAAEHHEKKSARKAEKADTQAVRDGSAARQRPSSRLQFTEEERADPVLGKYIDRSDRAADRLDAEKAAIPTKKVLRTERVFDETAGKGKTQLHFEEVEKRPNGRLRHNPLSRPVHEIVHAAHAKVHEVEQENVGVEAGHKGEVLTERGFAYGKGKVRAAIHHHRTKPWRDAAKAEQASVKANAEYLYQKALHDDPALAASNPVSRFLQKQRIKRNYAKELRQAEKTAKNTAATAKSAAQKAKDAFKETFLYIKHHSRAVLLVIGIGACVALLFGGVSSCSMMAGSGVGGVFTSSYLSEDADMLAAEAAYCELEQELQYELDHYETLHPGYDEYRFDLDEIEHDPYVLISILTAFHEGVFTIDEVQAELQMLFEKQYILTQTVEVEVRYRTETRTDSEGNDYDVEVPYNYYICNVKLENFDLSHVPVYIMDEETLSLYAVYMATLGNREDLFPGSGYVDKYTKPPTTYDIPPSALEDETFAALITEAEKYIGYPYVWGGSNPNTSFDCSGFVSWVLTQSGVCNTGRLGAQGLYNISTPVSSANARPGDLIFFVGTYDTPGVSHVGIYVGGGKMLHCGDPIQYADINTSYWQSHFYAFGRPPYN